MTALVIDSYRRAEEVNGGPNRPAWLHINDGTRSVGASVTVDHHDHEFASAVADAIAEVLPDATRAIAEARLAQADPEDRARRSRAKAVATAARLDAVLHGRRRVFGEALVRVTERGEVWLLDPVKQEAGFGLRFASLAELWLEHPELRPVRWQGGDLIVDSTIALAERDS